MDLRKIIELLPRSFWRSGIGVTISVLVRAIFNFAGLAILIPIFILLFDAGGISEDSIMGRFRSWTGITDDNTFIAVVCLIIFSFIISKNGGNKLLATFQIKYVTSLYRYYSGKLYENYYHRGLLYIKSTNTTALTYKINGVCYGFSQNVLSLLFTMLGDAMLLLLIWTGIAVYSLKIALLTLFCFVPLIWLYFYGVRRELEKNGRAENEERRKQARLVSETFKGYVEMEINHAFPLLKKQFEEGLSSISYYRERTDRMLRIPSEIVEISVVIVMILLVWLSKGNDEIKVVFGIFAVSIMRMLPAVRTLMTGGAQLKNNTYSIDIIKEAIEFENERMKHEKMKHEKNSSPVIFNHKIEVDNITFSFPDSTGKPVIDNFSMAVFKGERVGICGASGIGKSTLFNLLLGFYTPQSGNIYIDGKPLHETNRAMWHATIGYVPQDVFIVDGTLAQNIALGESMELIDRNRIVEVLEQVSLKTYADALPEGIDTRMGENGSLLSGGQRQRIGIARALYRQVEILLFDEATSSLDSSTEREITNAINELSDGNKTLTILIISHRESSLSFCDRIIAL